MNLDAWTKVDRYFSCLLHQPDPVLDATMAACAEARLPDIQVSEAQGKWLHLMVRISGARRVLEIGTLGGYSAIWMARALPEDGRLITLESDPNHVRVARSNVKCAGLEASVEVREGDARHLLTQLKKDRSVPFDLIFLDADKENYPVYFPYMLALSHPGTVIVADNVVRDGAVVEPHHPDPRVQGVRAFNQLVADSSQIDATGIQTVGVKGYDGYLIGLVR